jgi:hypothetical protein
MKLDRRHKWASYEDGELVHYECITCGEKRTDTVLAKLLWESVESLQAWRKLYEPVWLVPKLPSQPGETITLKRYPRLKLPTEIK